MTETQTMGGLLVTEAALTKITALLAAEEKDLFLRVAVQPGGCAGLRYELYFDDTELDRDVIMTFGDVTVVMDDKSAPYLGGATIDFADTISKQGFIIDNPNAAGTCQCGDSFN
ncbi:MAG: iron-sulfur cluster assembly accessory protein [Propionibacteriaceae bacterium]|jgi:iron-sulfur cluster assembly accessory protein|nr:iron-sulfur cluster assembly accessory protein [Propionibacteriaceae bacterium]